MTCAALISLALGGCSIAPSSGPLGDIQEYSAQATTRVANCHQIIGDDTGFLYVEGITLLAEVQPPGDFTFTGLLMETTNEVLGVRPVFLAGGSSHPGMSAILGATPDGFAETVVTIELPHTYDVSDGISSVGLLAEFAVDGTTNPSEPAIAIHGVEYEDSRDTRFVLPVDRELWVTRVPVGADNFCAEFE